jgi:hypothetical protein
VKYYSYPNDFELNINFFDGSTMNFYPCLSNLTSIVGVGGWEINISMQAKLTRIPQLSASSTFFLHYSNDQLKSVRP